MKEQLEAALNRLPFEQRRRRRALLELLSRMVREFRELPEGVSLRFSTGASSWMVIAEFVNLERLCLPETRFKLERDGGEGPIWLHVTGPEVSELVLRHWGLEVSVSQTALGMD